MSHLVVATVGEQKVSPGWEPNLPYRGKREGVPTELRMNPCSLQVLDPTLHSIALESKIPRRKPGFLIKPQN